MDYHEFINTANDSLTKYKSKFKKYIEDVNVPDREVYDEVLRNNEEQIDELYFNQKARIDEQFDYFSKLLEDFKTVEQEHLLRVRDYIKNIFSKILENYTTLQNEKEETEVLLECKHKEYEDFHDLDQVKKEVAMKEVFKTEENLIFKQKTISKCVQTFQKDKTQTENLKRLFEMHIEKYKENKINDIIRVLEKKIETVGKKYTEMNLESYLRDIAKEFDDLALQASRNHFNMHSRDLYIAIVNTNRIFSYNLDSGKFYVTEAEFNGELPIYKFPNYSRYISANGLLYISGGYDDTSKTILPYFFSYDKNQKQIKRLNDMIYGHSAHSMIYIPTDSSIIVVSGSGTLKCEKYDLCNNSWSELPEISVPRQNCTLFYYNMQYLYAFGGAYYDEFKRNYVYVESLERLNLGFGGISGNNYWEEVKTYFNNANNNLVNISKSVMSVLSYSASKILLVGGSVANNVYTDECVQFDFEKNEFSVKENISLPRKTCFPSKSFMHYNEKAYQLDNDGHVYEFDYKSDKFVFVKENSIMKK